MTTSVERLFSASIGKKAIMALTGLVLFGFVVGHMLGNLQIYLGPEKLNAYAAFLKATPALLWGTRVVLLLAVITHIVVAIQLTQQKQRARPTPYSYRDSVVVTYAARTMMWSGPILAAFIVYHLLHLTTGTAHQSFSHTDVYANVVAGFRIWYVSAAYIVAMLALGLHLVHGASSIFQSLGLSAANVAGLRRFATVATGAVVVGNISIPLAVLLGFVQ